ncbi:hypothetical protein PISMIDRAFT_110175, partial [Pisolithus microcarpus 441]
RDILLVDTPGCNDWLPDFQVLGEIARWLTAIYAKNIKLDDMLYFHPISEHTMRETTLRNFNMFKEACGKDNFKHVVFVTTMWDKVSEEVGWE